MNPMIRWAGGKTWFVSAFNYITREAKYNRLVELFAGGAAISFGRREKNVLLNDYNKALMCFYKAVRIGAFPQEIDGSVDNDLYRMLRLDFNKTCWEPDGFNDIALGHLFYFLNKYSFNGLWRENAAGEFNVPWNQKEYVPYPDFQPYHELMKPWELSNEDFSDVDLLDGDLLFADPPYDDGFTDYTPGGFNWKDQEALVKLLQVAAQRGFPVVATNLATPRIVELYRDHGFHTFTVEAPRRISSNGDRTPALELVAHNLKSAPTGNR